MVLVRSFKIVSISQESPDSLSQTVFVGLFGSLIQKSVGHQTRVSTVLYILTQQGYKMEKTTTKNKALKNLYNRRKD